MVAPRTVEVGKVKIGGLGSARPKKSGGTFRMPVKYDHFVITTLVRNETGDLAQDGDLMAELAADGYADADGKLRALPIILLSDNLEDSMMSSYLWYSGKKMIARSDGSQVTKFYDPKTLARLPEPIVSDWEDRFRLLKDSKTGAPLFKLHTTFNFIIANDKARWGGVYKFRTTSRISAEQLYGSLLQISQMTCGFLRGVPLLLRIRPMVVTPQGQDAPVTVYVVYCDIAARSMLQIRQQALQIAEADVKAGSRMKQLLLEYRRTLKPPGYDETEQETADIQEEFQPDPEAVTHEPEAPQESDPLMEFEDAQGKNKNNEHASPPSSAESKPEGENNGDVNSDIDDRRDSQDLS